MIDLRNLVKQEVVKFTIWDQVSQSRKEVAAIYIGSLCVWQAVRSCFGSGVWRNDKPWINEEKWKNNS